jgi:hypothetical protein
VPAKSKAQQQAAALAKHHPEKAKGAAKEMTKMSKKQLHDFAATPSKNLPEHVSKEGLDGYLDGYRTKTAADPETETKEHLVIPKGVRAKPGVREETTLRAGPDTSLEAGFLRAQAKRRAEQEKHLALPATEKIWPQAKGRLEEQFAQAAEQAAAEQNKHLALPSTEQIWPQAKKRLDVQMEGAADSSMVKRILAEQQSRRTKADAEERRPIAEGWMKQTPPSDETMAALAPKPAEAPTSASAAAPSLKDRLLASLQGGLESTRQFVGEHPLATAGAAVAGGAGLTAAALALKRKLEAKKKPVRRAAVA